jgi:penicillin-binding protein 1B
MKRSRLLAIGLTVIALAAGTVFVVLYRQVSIAFQSVPDQLPTRVYGGITRIHPGQSRSTVERKLRSLSYDTKVEAEALDFTLHQLDYPESLLPENHPTFSAMGKPVTLQFSSIEPTAELTEIKTETDQLPDLYLEPELVATLSGESSATRIREPVLLSEVPKFIGDAIVAAEDQHFYEHFGIDPRGFLRAMWVNLRTLSFSQGGSTITQQLVKNLIDRRGRNVFLKVNELFLAPILELQFTKRQILERYLNEVYLGQIGALEVRGVAEGAKHFFGKSIRELNNGEIALMVALIKGPAFYNPHKYMERAKTRQRYVLERMLATGRIDTSTYEAALQDPIRLAPPPQASNRAPYYVDFVRAEVHRVLQGTFSENEIDHAGFRIYTSLDLEANAAMQELVETGLAGLEKKFGIESSTPLQAALVSVDPQQGTIRSLIGGRNYAQTNFNRVLNMKRQVGSIFKPIVYSAALRTPGDGNGRLITAAYPIEDHPWSWIYDPKKPAWKPKNYDKENLGWIPLRKALYKSINTTSAQIAKIIGIQSVIDTATDLGIQSNMQAIPALSLGAVELSPIEVANAYATLANHGKRESLGVVLSITEPTGESLYTRDSDARVRMEPGVADLMTDLLQDVFKDGTARGAANMGWDRPAAGKTGTTNDYRDAWFAGYTPQLLTVLWIGFDQGTAAKKSVKLTGSNAALPIWIKAMNAALRDQPPLPFEVSEHLIEARLDAHTGQRAESGCSESQVVIEKIIASQEDRFNATCAENFENASEE